MSLDVGDLLVVFCVLGLLFYGIRVARQKGEAWQQNRQAGEAYWQQKQQQDGVQQVGDGVLVEYLQRGDGDVSPTLKQPIVVHYTGTLIDGTVFDCSRRRGEPLKFSLSQVIAGWQQGMQQLVVGDRVRLTIPQQLAYGRRQAGAIPPYSTLIFDVELLSIES